MREILVAFVAVVLSVGLARADAQPATSAILRDGNAAAAAGDWPRVTALVEPMFSAKLAPTDLAEAHRLAGIAAYFQQRPVDAEQHFLAYLRLDLDGQLDPSIYPPEAISFLANVRENHRAELRALRPKPKGSVWLSLLPPIGQFQNGERTKGVVVGVALGVFAIANISSYALLSSWCTRVAGSNGSSTTCDDSGDHVQGANTASAVNLLSGVGLIVTYLYGVYDGVSGYRRRAREASVTPYATTGFVGVIGSF